MSHAVGVHSIVPSAVRERNECRYSRAVAQDFASSRGRWLPAKKAGERLEPAFQGPILRTNRLGAFRVQLHLASLSQESFAPARLLHGTTERRPTGTWTPIYERSSRQPP